MVTYYNQISDELWDKISVILPEEKPAKTVGRQSFH